MTGWRLGYALAPKPLIDAMIKIQSQSTSNPKSIAQYAGLAAMTGPMDSVPIMLAEYCAAPRPHPGGPQLHLRHHLLGARRRVLRLPGCFRAVGKRLRRLHGPGSPFDGA